MSVKQMGKVWELDLTHTQQSLLLALADHADDDGRSIFPAVLYLAWKTGYSERAIRLIMGDLQRLRILVAVAPARGARPTEYALHLEEAHTKTPYKEWRGAKTAGVQSTPPGGAAHDSSIHLGTISSTEPSVKIKDKSLYVHKRKTKSQLIAEHQASEVVVQVNELVGSLAAGMKLQ